MARALEQATLDAISYKIISSNVTFRLNGADITTFLIDYSFSYDKQFGAATASFTLLNNEGEFGEGGATQINVGDTVEFFERFEGSTMEWKSFYGLVEQRSVQKDEGKRTLVLSCLDWISKLKNIDINLTVEGTKVKIENETLIPNFLPYPNDMFAHVFNFANDSIADNPKPIFTFRDKNHLTEDPQYDGFDIYYDVGQVKLGAPLNAKDNYDLIAKSYYFYTQGIYAEDILEQILTAPDGYGKYLFGEATAQAVINNHLITTLNAEEGVSEDYLTPNLATSTVVVKHNLVSAVTTGATVIYLDSTSGLPSSGTASICGDVFTYTGIGSGNTLVGIPSSGSNSLSAHPVGSVLKYDLSCSAGQLWYLKYSNVQSTLNSLSLTVGGSTASIKYIDYRNGRIVLTNPVSLVSVVKYSANYSFKTLQSTGIELNYMKFTEREVENRFEAINKLKNYLAPNYIVRTQGDSKIWASFLSQRPSADYTLNLVKNINYMEDDDLYTRTLFFAKNKEPKNLMFNENIDFVTTGASYKAMATQVELQYENTDENGWHIFKTLISNAGYIVADTFAPIVYINAIPIDNRLHQMIMQPIKIEQTTRTETTTTSSKFGGSHTSTNSWYYYKLKFQNQNLDPNSSITLFNSNGISSYVISPNDPAMDYGRGIYAVPGSQQNTTIEGLSTATYYVSYATNSLVIDYDNALFKINRNILPEPYSATIWGTFEYYAVFTPARGTGAIIDGRWDTQLQTEFFADPPSGYQYAILDFGSAKTIQAIDIVAGFYRPDEIRKFDIDFRFSLQYSLDGVDYYEIGDKTHNVQLTGGSSVSFEEEDLGVGFQARYFKIILENVKKIDYGKMSVVVTSSNKASLIDKGLATENTQIGSEVTLREGTWIVAISEVSAYSDIVLKSEAKLIPTTFVSGVPIGHVIPVETTEDFEEPVSGGSCTAYIGKSATRYFTYTGLTSTSFTGVEYGSGVTAPSSSDVITQSIESDTTIYDEQGLLRKQGDRLYKSNKISDEYLYTQTQLDYIAKSYLSEFYKEHTKLQVDIMFAPYLKIGQTISLTDSYGHVTNGLYFIESINNRNGNLQLTIAQYP